MKKLESKIQSLETEIAELKSMVALLVDNQRARIYQNITTSNNSTATSLQAGRDMHVINFHLNGEKQELLTLLKSVKEILP